jgi:hypothetical protein
LQQGAQGSHRLHSVILPPSSFSTRTAVSGSCSRSAASRSWRATML